jgi:hypothetical protein
VDMHHLFLSRWAAVKEQMVHGGGETSGHRLATPVRPLGETGWVLSHPGVESACRDSCSSGFYCRQQLRGPATVSVGLGAGVLAEVTRERTRAAAARATAAILRDI